MMTKKHKFPGKKLLVLALAAVLAAGLSGCHGAKEQSAFSIPEEFDTSKNYEITFWAKNDTNKTQTEIYKKAISDFEALYPNITVDLRLYTDYGKIYNDVITNIATETTPNVCITYPDHIATYLTGNDTVVPLDDLMADESYGLGGSKLEFDSVKSDEIIPQFLEECSFAGHYYALPFMRSTEVCYVNKTYVEKLGYTLPETLTWDFVWEVSEKAMEQNADGTYTGSYYYMTALNFSITKEVADDPGLLACKAKANPDDNVGNDNGDNLQKLTEIKDNSKMFVHGAPDSFIQSLTALLGVDAKKADTMEKSQSNLLYAIDTNRKSVSGVDEDEEGSDMIVFQNMLFNQYKMLNVLNEVLDKLINETGV